jgi:hypothetical protein
MPERPFGGVHPRERLLSRALREAPSPARANSARKSATPAAPAVIGARGLSIFGTTRAGSQRAIRRIAPVSEIEELHLHPPES